MEYVREEGGKGGKEIGKMGSDREGKAMGKGAGKVKR